MARLNEPAVPSESIDALKRRFVRQNRELARTNSNQSQRIRTLETEVSRLLAENLSLREQVINLTQDAEREHLSRHLGDDVLDVKGRLEAKLADLGSLIQELGALPQKRERLLSRARLSGTAGEKTSPDLRNWKNTITLGEVTSGQRIDHGQEGRLPVIMEDKYYPRRTMDNDEGLGGVISASTQADIIESPDLGPPPVAHFDEEEPIKFDPDQNRSNRDIREDLLGDETVFLPPNLETRRRRRDSSSTKSSSSLSTAPNLLQGNGITTGSSLKSGAKRKLSMLEDVQPVEAPSSPVPDDFQFNRKKGDAALVPPKRDVADKNSKENTDPLRSSPGKAKSSSRKEGGANRRALGPKSVNTDPTSPSKAAQLSVSDKIAELKEDVARQSKARQQAREKKNAVTTSIETQSKAMKESSLSDHQPEAPPETPAGLDLFSPASTEPSTRAEPRDTPPPGELKLSTSSSDNAGSFGRASRRPKGAVSYAEPNLRDKMRRPTKELADAVTGERFQRSTSVQAEDEAEGGDDDGASKLEMSKLRTVVVKRDDKVDRVGKPTDFPGSPLGAKSNGSTMDLPTSVLTERKRRASAAWKPQELSSRDVPSKTDLSDTEDPQRGTRNARGPPEDLEAAMGKLDIFDGPSSSPQPDNAPAEKDCTASRISRRHSSVTGLTKDLPPPGNLTSSRPDQAGAKPTGPRARPPLTVRSERDRASNRSENQPPRSKGDEDLKGAKSIVSMKDAAAGGSRADRAAARRRSMML